MSKFTPLLFLLIGGLCFYAGYTVGIRKAPSPANPETVAATQGPNAEAPERLEPTISEGPIEPAEVGIDQAVVEAHEHSLRAAKKQITFTDKQGRELVAEVLEASSDTLKVRRNADQAEVDLPVAMLIEEDQAFAAYLAKTMVKTVKLSDKTMEDKIWDELFR
jgi:hypothetical protein